MATWNAVLSFGLVTMNVGFEPATPDRAKTQDVKFRIVHRECMQPIKQPYTCPEHGPLESGTTTKALQVGDDFLEISPEALDEATPEASRDIEITSFVPIESVDAMFLDRSYYLIPDDSAIKAYSLLYHAMRKRDVGGLCKFVRLNREYLGFVRVMHGALGIQTMYVFDDVKFPDVELLSEKELGKSTCRLAEQAVDTLIAEFYPEELVSSYRADLHALVEAVKLGKKVSQTKPKEVRKEQDLVTALKATVKQMKVAA
jgi:DNA end-binding protein Ku